MLSNGIETDHLIYLFCC